MWLQRAREHMSRGEQNGASRSVRWMDWLADRYDPVVGCLANLPATLIHGDFYPSNVLIDESEGRLRICPVDWELAAMGPGLMDLAAFTAGKWSEEERLDLSMAYYDALPDGASAKTPVDHFLYCLDACRLHWSVQWLGWSSNWSPPVEEKQDWLGEAQRVAEKLAL